jgi:hypothetical protein
MATFYATTGVVTGGTTAANVTSIGYVWHPSSSTKVLRLLDVDLHGAAGNAGSYSVRLCKITAQADTPGGSSITPVGANGETSDCTFIAGATGAPTRGTDFFCDMTSASSDFDGDFEAFDDANPITIDAGVAGGVEVRVVVESSVSTGSKIAASFIWEEE